MSLSHSFRIYYAILPFLVQVSFGSLAREGSGSPLFVTENVTSATTHVTKVTKKTKNEIKITFIYVTDTAIGTSLSILIYRSFLSIDSKRRILGDKN